MTDNQSNYDPVALVSNSSSKTFESPAIALLKEGRFDEADTAFREALRLQPENAQALNNYGVFLQEQGKYEQAVEQLRKAAALCPQAADVHNNLGVALSGMKKIDEAVDCYRQSLRLNRGFALALNNLGNALRVLGRVEEAERYLAEALRVNPQYAEAWNNLGIVKVDRGELHEALAHYEKAAELKPDYVEACANRAYSLLAMGDFERGWVEYEWRWKCKDINARKYSQPEWDGFSFEGKTLLVYSEQGLGDILQFVRYLPLVQQRGGHLVFECPPPLLPLLLRCRGLGRLVPEKSPLPPFDLHVALLSLPRVLRTTLASVPAEVPYLAADPALVEKWGRELQSYHGFKIGVGWQGSAKYRGDAQRSMSLLHFGCLASVPGVRLFSLQKGAGREQVLTGGRYFPVIDLGGMLDETTGAFVDTAAAMKSLDLVVTSDSAIAHLAGGLGVPVWLALPFAADWRWLREREDSPWYPTMRLFRQKSPGDWEEVFARMANRLHERLGSKPSFPAVSAAMHEGERLHQQGLALLKDEKWPAAVPLFQEAIRLAPGNAGYRQNLGVALARQGKLEEAVASFRKVLELKPAATEAENNLALALLHLGEFEEAATLFEKAVAREPDNADFHNNLGIALGQLKKPAEAIAHFEEAIRLKPGFAEAERNLVNCRREYSATCEQLKGDEEARAVRYRPEFFEVETLDQAMRVVVTPERGTTTEERWEKETWFLVEDIGKHLDLNAESCVLDYGCGPGRVAKGLIDKYGCRVIGVDSSTSMRQLAPEYVCSERFSIWSPEVLEEKLAQGFRADRAICLWVIQHVPDPSAVIAKIGRALTPSGLLYALNQTTRCVPTNRGWHNDGLDVRAALRQAFDEIDFHSLPRDVTTAELAAGSMIQVLRGR